MGNNLLYFKLSGLPDWQAAILTSEFTAPRIGRQKTPGPGDASADLLMKWGVKRACGKGPLLGRVWARTFPRCPVMGPADRARKFQVQDTLHQRCIFANGLQVVVN